MFIHVICFQVFAIGQEDKRLYIRTNVVPEELVGREWKLLKMKKGSEKAGMYVTALQQYGGGHYFCKLLQTQKLLLTALFIFNFIFQKIL